MKYRSHLRASREAVYRGLLNPFERNSAIKPTLHTKTLSYLSKMHPTFPTTSPVLESLLIRNLSFSKSFHRQPTLNEQLEAFNATNAASNSSSPRPSTTKPHTCIITCCDPRVVPEYIFGLSLGEAVVLRTVGGSLAPALGGLLAIDNLPGHALTDVIVMRHTDCGTARWTDDGVRAVLRERCCSSSSNGARGEGEDAMGMVGRRGESVMEMGFGESVGEMGDVGLLREDVEWLRKSPLVREAMKRRVVGMLYSVETGEARVVC